MFTRFKIIFLIQMLCFTGTIGWSQKLNFKVAGDDEQGFSVDIYSGGHLLIQNTEEFSLRLANLDLSEIVEMPAWKGSEWTGDESEVHLFKETYVSEPDCEPMNIDTLSFSI